MKEDLSRNMKKMSGLFFVMDNNNLEGLKSWASELKERDIPAAIKVSEAMLDENPNVVKEISEAGFDMFGGFDKDALWDAPYEYQMENIGRIKEKFESCTGIPMKYFCAKFLSYNENTLKVADKLGIKYLFVLGTKGARAVIYHTDEYKTKIISVSSVLSSSGDRGSLCDHAMSNCGETPAGFREILHNLNEENIILVGWTTKSGIDEEWRSVFREFMDSGLVTWRLLGDLDPEVIKLPFAEVPVNRKE